MTRHLLLIAALAAAPVGAQTATQSHEAGRAAMTAGKWDEAIGHFERAAAAAPTDASHQLWLGRAAGRAAQNANPFRQAGLARKAKGAWERAVALDPDGIEARVDLVQYYLQAPGIVGGSVEKARAMQREIARRDPLQGHYAAAQIATDRKDWATAEREYRAATTVHPDSAPAWLNLAGFYVERERWADGAATYEQWLTKRPDDPLALYALGRIAAVGGHGLARGQQALERYLALAPTPTPTRQYPSTANARARLGQVLARQGKGAEAKAQFEQALRLDPKNELAKEGLQKTRS
jgi:tetratricopeptide (TPR) repeat protein